MATEYIADLLSDIKALDFVTLIANMFFVQKDM